METNIVVLLGLIGFAAFLTGIGLWSVSFMLVVGGVILMLLSLLGMIKVIKKD